MSYLAKIAILATKDKSEKKAKSKSELMQAFEKDIAAKMLEASRRRLADALHHNYDQKSPAFRRILSTFRQKWLDFYKFPLRPEQEKRYMEVLKDRSGETTSEKNS